MTQRICYVHAGVGKTGSSAIQYALTIQRDYLAQRGFSYPDLSGDFRKVLAGEATGGNASAVLQALREGDGGDKQIVRLLSSFSDRPENLILSCEGLSNRSPSQLEELVRSLRALGYESRCLVFFRPQADIMVSSFLQQIRTGRIRQVTLEQYVEEQMASGQMEGRWNWHARAVKLAQAFGDKNLSVKWYPAVAGIGPHGVVTATFDWLGVPLPPGPVLAYSRNINPTPGREAVKVLELLDSQGYGGKRFTDKLLLRAEKQGMLGTKVRLERALLDRVNAMMRDSNLKLRESYIPDLDAHEELDSRSYEQQSEPLDTQTIERLKEIAARILRRMAARRQP